MKLPAPFTHVWLRREPYELLTDEAAKYGAMDDCDGEINNCLGTIKIRDDATGTAFLCILGHECTHFALAWSGLSQILQSHDESGKLEEAVCDAMGRALVEFIAENPEVCRYVWRVFSELHGETDTSKQP
jgi:hypothetical protein